jgi:1,4-alpha-glucan branching enzyme
MKSTAAPEDISRVISTDHHDPFGVLGPHKLNGNRLAIRAFLPEAESATVLGLEGEYSGKEYPMERIRPEGFFEVVIPKCTEVFPYKLRKSMPGGKVEVFHDSYSFLPTLTDVDVYLFGAGNHHRVYEKLGAHYAEIQGLGGVQWMGSAIARDACPRILWDLGDLHSRAAGRRAVQVPDKDGRGKNH